MTNNEASRNPEGAVSEATLFELAEPQEQALFPRADLRRRWSCDRAGSDYRGGTRHQPGTDIKMALASLFGTWQAKGLRSLPIVPPVVHIPLSLKGYITFCTATELSKVAFKTRRRLGVLI